MSPDPLMILVVGVGFKKGQTVLSNSPGMAIIRTILEEWDAYVQFADPLVDAEQIDFCLRIDIEEDWNEANLHTFDGIIVAVMSIPASRDARCAGTQFLSDARLAHNTIVN